MSKAVKDLVISGLSKRLEGVNDCVLVDVIGMEANNTCALRKRLRDKNISLTVVKNGLARRATEGTPLAPAFEQMEGSLAVCWGGEDFVDLVKEVTELDKSDEFDKFEARGGVMDGESLTSDKVKEISKWPNRAEQLSLLAGQIMGPGATLAAQLIGPGGTLVGQIKSKSEE
ncbi:50S ribosomal protein L10 [Pirellulaceae bacterium]|jgi:ribosomal protein L10|nr:50S ribosomal protein L10 [Pirellulaceae bacterium]